MCTSGLSVSPRFFRVDYAKELVAYGYHTLVAQVADLLRFKLSPLILTGFRGTAFAGWFDHADKLNRIVGELTKALISVLGPVFSRSRRQGRRSRNAARVLVHDQDRRLHVRHARRLHGHLR